MLTSSRLEQSRAGAQGMTQVLQQKQVEYDADKAGFKIYPRDMLVPNLLAPVSLARASRGPWRDWRLHSIRPASTPTVLSSSEDATANAKEFNAL